MAHNVGLGIIIESSTWMESQRPNTEHSYLRTNLFFSLSFSLWCFFSRASKNVVRTLHTNDAQRWKIHQHFYFRSATRQIINLFNHLMCTRTLFFYLISHRVIRNLTAVRFQLFASFQRRVLSRRRCYCCCWQIWNSQLYPVIWYLTNPIFFYTFILQNLLTVGTRQGREKNSHNKCNCLVVCAFFLILWLSLSSLCTKLSSNEHTLFFACSRTPRICVYEKFRVGGIFSAKNRDSQIKFSKSERARVFRKSTHFVPLVCLSLSRSHFIRIWWCNKCCA